MKNPGNLFICATPIGNFKDKSERLVETLSMVDLIAAEDTRKTVVLLQHLGLKKPMYSLQKFNEAERINFFKEQLLAGKNIALVSDAGTPNISDPGSYLISKLLDEGISIVPIPGPSSVTTLLSISGILANQFIFFGFCPKKKSQIEKQLKLLQESEYPGVYFESGKRIIKTLGILQELVPESQIFLAKELTKTFERYFRGNIKNVLDQITKVSLKGEWCFILKSKEI